MYRIFTFINIFIILPIVMIIKWILILILSICFVPIFYIIYNLFRSYDYTGFFEWVNYIKNRLDEFINFIFNWSDRVL